MVYSGSGCRQVAGFLLCGLWRFRRICLEAEAVVATLDDVVLVCEPVVESDGHLGIAEDAGLFAEARIGCNDHAGALAELVCSASVRSRCRPKC
jgi:hypothetical protein